MTERQSLLGKIEISSNAIRTLAAESVLECYGVVGLAGKSRFKDWRAGLLNRDNAHRGVQVMMDNESITVDLYIIIEYGTRISEVARNVMQRVKYTLEQSLGLPIAGVNVHVQGLRVSDPISHTKQH